MQSLATAGQIAAVVEPKAAQPPRVAVIIVTWNRKDMAQGAIDAVARQSHPTSLLDVILVDNASTDGTLDALAKRYRPEVIVDNPTRHAHQPDFRPRPVGERLGNTAGLGSLTIIRNTDNHGGCGGFNTGLAYVETALVADRRARALDGAPNAPEFVWLVDDDIDLPQDALTHLLSAMRTDPRIGIVGSRTVDLRDRKTTIETTIYQERATGVFADQPDQSHPTRQSHDHWVATVGGVKGRRNFTGLRDVDIVSACSMLARWSAVEKVGLWDHRYFIYCDDADWCLRMSHAGFRVVLNLDAVVFHQPWHHKLTPTRLYYAQRNLLWTILKSFSGDQLQRVLNVRARIMLKQSLGAALSHRLNHAEVLRQALDDAMNNRGGKVDLDPPPSIPLAQAARTIAQGRKRLRLVFVIHRPIAVDWAQGLRSSLREGLGDAVELKTVEMVRNDTPGAHELPPVEGVTRAVYAPSLKSRLRRQLALLTSRADAVVIFDNAGDLGLVRTPRWVMHVASAKPGEVILERGSRRARLAFLGRWLQTALRARRWAARATPNWPEGKFGGRPAGS